MHLLEALLMMTLGYSCHMYMSAPLIVIDKGSGLEKAAGTMIKNKVRQTSCSGKR
jgi:hypothetical protein